MVSELDIGRCASEDAGSRRGWIVMSHISWGSEYHKTKLDIRRCANENAEPRRGWIVMSHIGNNKVTSCIYHFQNSTIFIYYYYLFIIFVDLQDLFIYYICSHNGILLWAINLKFYVTYMFVTYSKLVGPYLYHSCV